MMDNLSESGPEEQQSVESLLQILASCSIDAQSPKVRKSIEKRALLSLPFITDADNLVAVANTCSSPHSQKRLVWLFTNALLTTDKPLGCICSALCKTLARATHPTRLMHLCLVQLKSRADRTVSQAILDAMTPIWKDADGSVPDWCAALSICTHLLTKLGVLDDKIHTEMLTILLKLSLGNKFGSMQANQFLILRPYLHSISQNQVDAVLAPTISLKLKANPESVIESVKYILENLSTSNIDFTHTLLETSDVKLFTTILKQIRSTKEHVRRTAVDIFVQIATMVGCGGEMAYASANTVLIYLIDALAVKPKDLPVALSLNQPILRGAAYEILGRVGLNLSMSVESIARLCVPNQSNLSWLSTVDSLLSTLVSLLVKEPIGDVSILGNQALMVWIWIAKALCRNFAVTNPPSGYVAALDYCAKPMLNGTNVPQASGASSNTGFDFRSVGSFIAFIEVQTAKGHIDLLDPLVVDIIQRNEKKCLAGLQIIIEAAMKKFTNYKSVPQIDGLIAVFVEVVYTTASYPENDCLCKLASSTVKSLTAGSAPFHSDKVSFLYSKAMLDAAITDSLIGFLLHMTLARLYKHLISTNASNSTTAFSELLNESMDGSVSAAAYAMASCICNYQPSFATIAATAIPTRLSYHILDTNISALCSSLQISKVLLSAVFLYINTVTYQSDMALSSLTIQEARNLRESIDLFSEQKQTCPINSSYVQRVARMFLKSPADIDNPATVGKGLILLHAGTTIKTAFSQRSTLGIVTVGILSQINLANDTMQDSDITSDVTVATLDDFLINCASFDPRAASCQEQLESIQVCHVYSDFIFRASSSLMSTIGILAGRYKSDLHEADVSSLSLKGYEAAWYLCVAKIAPRLSARLLESLRAIEALTCSEVDLFLGIYNEAEVKGSSDANGGAKMAPKAQALNEDEKWDQAVRRELEEKKLASAVSGGSGSEGERKVIERKQRGKVSKLLDYDFSRSLQCLENLVQSDIELGNTLLQIFSKPVLWSVLSPSYAFEAVSTIGHLPIHSLRVLAECVYEIDETHLNTILCALRYSCTRPNLEQSEIIYNPLPSSCLPVSETLQEIQEQDLSPGSFTFLFPIIRAALTGPRTCGGCDGALLILQQHTFLLNVDERFRSMRKEMVSAVLELLTHDRCQVFTDPTPYEVLESIYLPDDNSATALTSSDLSPLFGNMGALGMKHSRIGAMVVLRSIVTRFPDLAKNNALLENRIWINCFSDEDEIKAAARAAWKAAYGGEGQSDLSSPSKLITTALLPLLGSTDQSIARAAAFAYAHALSRHQDIVEKSIHRLLNSYIDAYPTSPVDLDSSKKSHDHGPVSVHELSKPQISASTAKKPVKKPASSAASSVMAALATTKKKSTSGSSVTPKTALSSILKPKERTMDKEVLEAQLKVSATGDATLSEKDDNAKVLTRKGVIRVITSLAAPSCDIELSDQVLQLLIGFLVGFGLADRNDEVYCEARDSLRDIVAKCGSSQESLTWLFPVLEQVMSSGGANFDLVKTLDNHKIPGDIDTIDRRKEGVVVALGSAATHLKDEVDSDKIAATIDMLIKTLSTPSESVQSSVALCLSKLMKKGRTQDRVENILSSLIKTCFDGNSLAQRRGAAYGIAAIIKGSGIAALKKFEVIKQLEDACNEGSPNTKEGALFAIELLSSHLGLLFEPYVIVLLPALLQSFSDNSVHVRASAQTTMGTIMNKLSGHGVKLILPSVLAGLENDEWRAAVASISLLGSMSNLAPKQLATCLPQIVPKLTEAFTATHPKVKASAEDALDEIVKVVRNPEIKSISRTLLNALKDPSAYTSTALEALIETEFIHAIDAPSLALIVPVLHRGLKDRTATTKRFGALIAGNLCTMIQDPKDFVPYVPLLIADLKAALLDPIPDCRSTAANSLGSLTRSLGEATFPDLRPWLVDMLKSDAGSSEKSGAAQGLSEVLCAGGANMVENVLRNEILPLRSYPKASIREGVFWVLTFLPSSLGQAFAPLIDYSFPSLIIGLSDDNEPVRDVAMRAGRIMIQVHGKAHVDKFLPSLEAGLNDDDSRIRVSSLTLLGDLFNTIAGAKISKGDSDTQDDIRQAERAQSQIALILGSETRKRILSSLYFRRSDSAAVVRQIAIQVWKSIVSVTPRTLREILDTLVGQIAIALASGNPDRTNVGGRCLGDLTSKLGDTVLPEVIPVLQRALYSSDQHTRIGACVGLTEVISCSSKEQLLKFVEILVKAVRDALCDEQQDVRKMAISAFQQLYSVLGSRVLDEIVPALLVSMDADDERRTRAIYGLTGILTVRSKELLPFLVPRLLRKPITISQATALGSVCSATRGTIHLFFPVIIPALLSELAVFNANTNEVDAERSGSLRSCVRVICGSIETTGVNPLLSELTTKCNSDKDVIRKESCWFLSCLIEERKNLGDFYDLVPLMMRELLCRFNDESAMVVKSASDALLALSNNVSAEVLVDHIEFMRNVIASLVSDARRRKGGVGDGEFLLPGFNIPKGLEPLLPIYQRGILYGDSSARENAAIGLGELIKLTSSQCLGPFAVKITGPLLRIVGDRNPSSVKVAIIETLGLILSKGGPLLKAFVPQFQTTFVKALSDPSRLVRLEAIKALGLLMPLSTRVDPLIKELVSGARGETLVTPSIESTGGIAIQIASLEALATVLACGGSKVQSPDIISSAVSVGTLMAQHDDEDMREVATKVIQVASELQKSL